MAQSSDTRKGWYDVLIGLTPLILGICVTGVGAFFTHSYNFSQLQLSRIAALEKFRPMLVSTNPYDREFAYASFVSLGHEQLALKLIRINQDPAGRAVAQDIKESASGTVKEQASAALAAIPARVFLHVASDTQQRSAEQIAATLKDRGYVVPGIENVSGKAQSPKKTNVRYFNSEDQAAAESIAQVLRERGIADASPYHVSMFKVRPGSLEVWFAPDVK